MLLSLYLIKFSITPVLFSLEKEKGGHSTEAIDQSFLHNQRTMLIASLCYAIFNTEQNDPCSNVCSLFLYNLIHKCFSWTFFPRSKVASDTGHGFDKEVCSHGGKWWCSSHDQRVRRIEPARAQKTTIARGQL
jgi:hypothetical protein